MLCTMSWPIFNQIWLQQLKNENLIQLCSEFITKQAQKIFWKTIRKKETKIEKKIMTILGKIYLIYNNIKLKNFYISKTKKHTFFLFISEQIST